MAIVVTTLSISLTCHELWQATAEGYRVALPPSLPLPRLSVYRNRGISIVIGIIEYRHLKRQAKRASNLTDCLQMNLN